MDNANQNLLAIHAIASYQWSNGSYSSLRHVYIGPNTNELFEAIVYDIFSSHVCSYEDGGAWFKAIDAMTLEKSKFYYNANNKALVMDVQYTPQNPLIIRSMQLAIEELQVLEDGIDAYKSEVLVTYPNARIAPTEEVHKFKYMGEHDLTMQSNIILAFKGLFMAKAQVVAST